MRYLDQRFDREDVVAAVRRFKMNDGCGLVSDRIFNFLGGASVCSSDLNEASARCQVQMVVTESVVALDDQFVRYVIRDW